MKTVTFDVPEDLAEQLSQVGDRLPDLLTFALKMAGVPVKATALPVQSSPAWLEAVDFLASQPSPQEIVDFKLSPQIQTRLEELLVQHQSGVVSPQANAELDTLRMLNHLFILLKARARASLAEV